MPSIEGRLTEPGGFVSMGERRRTVMSLKAAFSEMDITPEIGTKKAGWLKFDSTDVSDTVKDNLFARAAILQTEATRIAFISLDILSIRWTQTSHIRRRIEQQFGFPGANIMICATHNHAGPATVNLGDTRRDEKYLEFLEEAVVRAFQKALNGLREAQLGFGHIYEWEVAYNRRVVMRDGTARMKGSFSDAASLHLEGPIDPEVAVIAVQTTGGENLGTIVNFACHPIHHGGDTVISAGYPGALAREMKARGWPATLFLNGASGNLSHGDPSGTHEEKTLDQVGAVLACDVERVIKTLAYSHEVILHSQSKTVRLPFRKITDDEIRGTTRGAQRSVEYEISSVYERDIPSTVAKIRSRRFNLAEIQVFHVDNVAFAATPAELFVENGLLIKEKAFPVHALVVSHANGAVGYVPHKGAFLRGGYETTFGGWSRLAPQAADVIIETAVDLIGSRNWKKGRR
jgi:neutral ceramidase